MLRFRQKADTGLVKRTLLYFAPAASGYLTSQFDAALNQGKGLKEGETAVVRGQTWRGWAKRDVKKYGVVVVEGTRFYMRKFSRGSALTKRTGATESQSWRKAFWGTKRAEPHFWNNRPARNEAKVHDRPFERIWNKRTGGQRYSESAELMRATKAMQNSLANIRVSLYGDTALEFRLIAPTDYFQFQNKMRPIFVFDAPVDAPRLAKMIGPVLRELIQ